MGQSAHLPELDLGSLMGSQLMALVDAQCHASEATLRFIKSVGFDGSELHTTTFKLASRAADAQSPERPESEEPHERLELPTLSLIPIPYFRVKEATLEFRTRVVAAEPTRTRGAAVEPTPATSPAPLRLISVFANRHSRDGVERGHRYSMHVTLKAVQDDLPEGLERLLGQLERR